MLDLPTAQAIRPGCNSTETKTTNVTQSIGSTSGCVRRYLIPRVSQEGWEVQRLHFRVAERCSTLVMADKISPAKILKCFNFWLPERGALL